MSQQKIGLLLVNGPLPPPYGGVATYLAHTLPLLAARGFEVHTIIDRPPADPKHYRAFQEAGIHVYYAEASRLKKIGQILKRVPLWVSTLFSSRIGPVALLSALKSISSWIGVAESIVRNHSIEIIHAYDYPWAQGFVAACLAKRYRKSFVQTIFGEVVPHKSELEHHDAFGDRFKNLVRGVLEQSDLLLSV
ncbi:MAG: glycosyltransferase family 4 protein, partial [Ignavibacteria bacterium]|nr:glycosyltransferase family 4 protein [Ignavibacteria bacterium]